MKKLLLTLMVILGYLGTSAQVNQPLPLNPNVLHGTLPNGLNYYILHNAEPKERANFYIAQKVGSSLETPEQFGLAHFLEHMAFNGTSHYPGKDMLNYLQGKGIRFGADINAYTSFDETVYNINNVPTTDQALMDSVLLVLADWSGSILLEEDEINAERGVIEGEYIMRNDANSRMLSAILPQLFKEYQYQQTPIGTMEVVKNFPPQVLRDYYKKWYRPDLQGIIIVGDFDAKEMEAKVVELFSKIPMPENAAPRIYPTISDNDTPIYVTFTDPELQMPRIDTFFKFDLTPVEMRNTVMGYLSDVLLSDMVSTMINNRLREYSQKPDCPFSYAGVSVGDYLVAKQKGSFTVIVIPKDNYDEAYRAAMGVVVRACKTGFMGTEVQRVRDQVLAHFEELYNEKDKTNSESLGRELIAYFIENTPDPGIEIEYNLAKSLLPAIPEAVFNEYASHLIHADNVAILVSQPATMAMDVPEEKAMLNALTEVISADYEPYVDEVITEPLISELPKPGTIVKEKDNADLGCKEFTLSNGVKVLVKPTDYANDEILFQMFKAGGKSSYPSDEAADVLGLDLVLEVSNIGPFDPTKISKYFAGKRASLTFNTGNYNNYFLGNSTVKDVESLFELLYASFTDVTPNQESFDAYMGQIRGLLANQENNPEYIFNLSRFQKMYPNSPVLYPLSLSTLQKMDYAKMMNLYKESVKNAADYTVTIVGNVDIETIKPLLMQYVATLPSNGVKSPAPAPCINTNAVTGIVNDVINIPSQNPTVYVFDWIWQPGMVYSTANEVKMRLLGQVLGQVFLETLREEMGGTYSPHASASLDPYTSSWRINWYIVTSEEVQQAIVDRANAEFKKLLSEGTDAEHFSKVREAAIKAFDLSVRTNSYWQNGLLMTERGFDALHGQREALEALTLDEFNKFLTTLYNGENKFELIGIAK